MEARVEGGRPDGRSSSEIPAGDKLNFRVAVGMVRNGQNHDQSVLKAESIGCAFGSDRGCEREGEVVYGV